jgi:hypothetical protein
VRQLLAACCGFVHAYCGSSERAHKRLQGRKDPANTSGFASEARDAR